MFFLKVPPSKLPFLKCLKYALNICLEGIYNFLDRQRDKGGSSICCSFHKYLQRSGLAEVEARHLELNLGLLHGWQELKQWNHHHSLPRCAHQQAAGWDRLMRGVCIPSGRMAASDMYPFVFWSADSTHCELCVSACIFKAGCTFLRSWGYAVGRQYRWLCH